MKSGVLHEYFYFWYFKYMLNAELLLVTEHFFTVVLVFSLKYNIKSFLLFPGCYFKD